MYLSASVLAAAVLSSALTINSSGRDAPAAITGMASHPGLAPRPHAPNVLISKRAGPLEPRSPEDTSETSIQPAGAGSQPTPLTSGEPKPNAGSTAGGGPSSLNTLDEGKPLPRPVSLPSNKIEDEENTALTDGSSLPSTPLPSKEKDTTTPPASVPTNNPPNPQTSEKEEKSHPGGGGSPPARVRVGHAPLPSENQLGDESAPGGEHETSHDQGVSDSKQAPTASAVDKLMTANASEESTSTPSVLASHSILGPSGSGFLSAEERKFNEVVDEYIKEKKRKKENPEANNDDTSKQESKTQTASPATRTVSSSGQDEEEPAAAQKREELENAIGGLAAPTSQTSSPHGPSGSSQTATPAPDSMPSDKYNAPDSAQNQKEKVDEKEGDEVKDMAGKEAGKDEIEEASSHLGPDKSSKPSASTATGTPTVTGAPSGSGNTSDTEKGLKPSEPSVTSTLSGSSNSPATSDSAPGEPLGPESSMTFGTSATEAGTQTKPGPLATATEASVAHAPVISTMSTDISEVAATDRPALLYSSSAHVSNGTAKPTDASTLGYGVKSTVTPGTASATATSVPPFPTSRLWKFANDSSTAASTPTRPEAGTGTAPSAKPTYVSVRPVSVSSFVSAKANVTFPRSFVIVDGAAYFPGLVKGSGYFRVVVDVAASLVFRIERCQRDERNTVVVKAKGEYRYLECSGAECNTVVRVEACGIVRVAPCAGQCDASVFCQRAGQCVDAGQRPALPRAPAAVAANSTKVTMDISVRALAQVNVTPQGSVTGLIRAVAEVQASRGGGTVSILAKAFTSPGVPALPASPASGSKPAPNTGSKEAPAPGSGTMSSPDSDKGPAAHEKTAAHSHEHEQRPASAAEGGVSLEPGSKIAPTGAPAQPNSAAADDTAPRPQYAAATPDQPPAAPLKATTGPVSPFNDRVSPSRPQDQRPGNGPGQAPASAVKAAASKHIVGAHLVGALAVWVFIA